MLISLISKKETFLPRQKYFKLICPCSPQSLVQFGSNILTYWDNQYVLSQGKHTELHHSVSPSRGLRDRKVIKASAFHRVKPWFDHQYQGMTLGPKGKRGDLDAQERD